MKLAYQALGLLLCSVGFQTANASSYHSDGVDGFRPRCIALANQKSVFFKWNDSDKYYRELKYKIQKTPCSEWRRIEPTILGWKDLSNDPSQDGFTFERDAIKALEQVRNGAGIIREEMTAAEYLKAHPIADYTQDVNKMLTARYGMGFSASVYHEFVKSIPLDKAARASITERFNEFYRNTSLIPNLGNNTKVLLASGFGIDYELHDSTPDYVRKILLENKMYNFDFLPMKNQLVGPLSTNADMFAKQIEEQLSQGHDLVVAGLSKGVPELLKAVTLVFEGKMTQDNKQIVVPGRGRILGLVNLSGLVTGTFVGDAFRGFGGAETLANLLKRTSLNFGSNNLGAYLQTLKDLDQKSVDEFVKPVWSRLPSDINYVTLAGAYTDFSKPVSKYLEADQLFSIARSLNLTDMAHDGLINLPGMALPKALSPSVVTIVLEGDHTVYDGFFDNIDLKDQANRISFNKAIFEFAARPL